MANIDLNPEPTPVMFPFHTVPGAQLPYTAAPRGRVTFRVNAVTIAAKIATNTTSIRIEMILPANFAYIFEYGTVQVAFPTNTGDADNYDSVGVGITRLGDGSGGRHNQLFSRGITGNTLNAGSEKTWSVLDMYPSPLYNVDQIAPQLDYFINDTDAGATVVGMVSSYASFLIYDIEQVFNAPLNFPLPVSVR